METIPDPTPDFEAAAYALDRFLAPISLDARLVCLHDCDADGVAAGVVWQRSMERLGYSHLCRIIPDRERSAWTAGNRARVRGEAPHFLFVLDLGSQPVPIVEDVPACFIDHHRPGGVLPGDTLISAYTWNPIPNTSLLVWELLGTRTEAADLDWIAAIGTFSDLGERAPFPLIEETKRRYRAKYLKEATTLVNAVRRASAYHPEAAALALLNHTSPRELVESGTSEVRELYTAREEVKAALEEAKKAAPVFSGKVALIRLSSKCQVHPLIAQIWRSRLPNYIVFAANEGYLPGRVNFSVRAREGINVLDFLRSIHLPGGEGKFGYGHDQASGGSLPTDLWNTLLLSLGFPPSVLASPDPPPDP